MTVFPFGYDYDPHGPRPPDRRHDATRAAHTTVSERRVTRSGYVEIPAYLS